MAPYDFVVASGRVVRPAYCASEQPFGPEGTWCWVMQFVGAGRTRLVSLKVASRNGADQIIAQVSVAPITPE